MYFTVMIILYRFNFVNINYFLTLIALYYFAKVFPAIYDIEENEDFD
jgi:hypothetical protein